MSAKPLNLSDQIKAAANLFTDTVISDRLEINFPKTEKVVEYKFKIPGREDSLIMAMHRPATKISQPEIITSCVYPNGTSTIVNSGGFSLVVEGKNRMSAAFDYWQTISSINAYLDEIIGGNLNSEKRKIDLQKIINAAFADEPSELENLSQSLNININYGTHYSNAISFILQKLLSPRNSDHNPVLEENTNKLEAAAVRLLDLGAIPEPIYYQPLMNAIKNGYMNLAKALIRNDLAYEAKLPCIVGYRSLPAGEILWGAFDENDFYQPVAGNLLDLANFYKQRGIAQTLIDDLKMEPHIKDYNSLIQEQNLPG